MIRIKNVTYLILLLSFTFPLLGMEIVKSSLSNPALPLALCTLNLEREENDPSGVMLKGFASYLSSFVTGDATSFLKYVPGVRLFCFFKEMREKRARDAIKKKIIGDTLKSYFQQSMTVNELEAYFQQIRKQGKVIVPEAIFQQIRKKREELNEFPIKKYLENECNNLEELIRRKKFREALELYIMLKPCQLVSESLLRSKVSSGFSCSELTSIRDDEQMEYFKRFFYLLNNQEDLNGQYDGIPQLFSSDVHGDEAGSSSANLTNNSPENYAQEDFDSSSDDIISEINLLADVVQPVWQKTGRIEGKNNAAHKIGSHNKRRNEPIHNNLNDQDDGVELFSSTGPEEKVGSSSTMSDIVPKIDLADAVPQEQRDETSPNIGVRTGCFTGLKNKCASFLTYLKKLCGYSKPPWTVIESYTFNRTEDELDCTSCHFEPDVVVNGSECIRTKIKNIFLSFIRLASFRRFFSH